MLFVTVGIISIYWYYCLSCLRFTVINNNIMDSTNSTDNCLSNDNQFEIPSSLPDMPKAPATNTTDSDSDLQYEDCQAFLLPSAFVVIYKYRYIMLGFIFCLVHSYIWVSIRLFGNSLFPFITNVLLARIMHAVMGRTTISLFHLVCLTF